jgi:hypothetical protein
MLINEIYYFKSPLGAIPNIVDMKFESFLPDILAAVIGGALLVFFLYIIREKIFKTISFDGSWVYEQMTQVSSYNPYIGMNLGYIGLVARDGYKLYGSAEKIFEITSAGVKREYNGKNRTQVVISGHVEKQYFSKDKYVIHISEQGEIRDSTTIHTLYRLDENTLVGKFSSTIANQLGTVKWTRKSS